MTSPPKSSNCVGSAPHNIVDRIFPIMTGSSSSPDSAQQPQHRPGHLSQQKPAQRSQHVTDAQLVALHTGSQRHPPEGSLHKHDGKPWSGRRRPASGSAQAIDSEMDMDIERPSVSQHSNLSKKRTDSWPRETDSERKIQEGESSGDSGRTGRSKPEDWFNSLNSNVRGHQTFADYSTDDSPYYVSRRRHQEGSRHSRQKSSRPYGDSMRPQTGDVSIEETNSDSFRSVIDDLTVKNQKLKKRLRRLEGLQGLGSRGERLFEVRIHDLPEHKKQELERILQSFSASLENVSPETDSANNTTPPDQSTTVPDSGYASFPTNGESSAGGSSSSGSKSSDPLRPWPSSSEMAKMKIVVEKLEHLFTGANAIGGDRSQLLRQQDISDSAADDDRRAAKAAGVRTFAEGTREAAMMDGISPESDDRDSGSSSNTEKMHPPNAMTISPEGMEQRPTRPMDLDPERCQVPEENIEYLTHMTESSAKGATVGDGWVYLNLVINLAQLHTINITPDFVKKAITSASNKLELSPDGGMVRWKGAREGSTSGSNNDSVCPRSEGTPGSGGYQQIGGDKSSSNNDASGSAFGGKQESVSSNDNKFHYKPLLVQPQSLDDENSSTMTSSESDERSGSDGYADGVRNAGPIIYYKGGNFCTDLSSAPLTRSPPYDYQRVTDRPLGASDLSGPSGDEKKSPLHQFNISTAEDKSDAMDIDGSDDAEAIHFSPEFTATRPSSPIPPIEFEASGIGGVLPADNFAINCQTRHFLHPDSTLPVSRTKTYRKKLHKRLLHRIPQRSLDSFYETDGSPAASPVHPRSSRQSSPSDSPPIIRHQILSAKTTRLPPSSLPPASFFVASSSSSETADSTDDDIIPRSSGSEDYYGVSSTPQLDDFRINSSGEENNSSSSVLPAAYLMPSPSSVATAGDGSYQGDMLGVDVDDDDFSGPLSMEENSGSGEGIMGTGHPSASHDGVGAIATNFIEREMHEQERPNLKRMRNISGSVRSSGSAMRHTKNQKMDYSGSGDS